MHGGAFDFNRFTHLGHRRLWRYFDEVDSGAQRGPGTALLLSTDYFLRAYRGREQDAPRDDRRAVALFGFWTKYVDDYLVRRPRRIDAAAAHLLPRHEARDARARPRDRRCGFRGVFPDGERLPTVRPELPAEPDEEIRVSRGSGSRRKERSASGV